MRKAKANEYGDIICPYCKVNIITPAGCIVRSGIGHCVCCKEDFEVEKKVADQANERIKT